MKRVFLISIMVLMTMTMVASHEYCVNDVCQSPVQTNDKTSYDGWAVRTFNAMSLDEKIGQLFVVTSISDPDLLNPHWKSFYEEAVGHANVTCSWSQYANPEQVQEAIEKFHIGGVIFLGRGRVDSQINLTNYFRSRSKYPLLIAQDFETSLNDRLEDTLNFPHAMTLGALSNDSLVYEMGRDVAEQSKRLGVDVVLGPVVDVNTDYENPVINVRSFGEDKENVVRKAVAYMQGLQDAGIVADAKHFPGHGDTKLDSHHDLPRILKLLAALVATELYPFKKLIEAGVMSIMTAHLEIPALEQEEHLPSSLSHSIVTDLLRNQMGFNGLIITDALVMKGVTKHHKPGEIELKALLAGNDILLCPTNLALGVAAIKEALNNGTLDYKTLDDHVMRILTVKEWLLKRDGCKTNIDDTNLERLQSSASHDLKDRLYVEAITLCPDKEASDLSHLMNNSKTIIQISGQAPDIFEQELSEHFGIKNYFHLKGHATEEDVAELLHRCQDDTSLVISIKDIHPRDKHSYGIPQIGLYLIDKLRMQGKKLIIVLFGTPYSLRLFKKSDFVIMAYEDDPSAQEAAAEIVCGREQALGILPVSDLRRDD
jgi:beta-N-acetylhexosaminidase